MNGEDLDPATLPDLFTTLLDRQIEDDGGEVDWRKSSYEEASEQGRELVACHLENIDPEEQVLAVNETFCVPLIDASGNAAEWPLIGEADLVVENGKRTVVDWKTSGTRYSDWKVSRSLQATAMLYGIGNTMGKMDAFRFDIVVKLKRAPVFESYETKRTVDDYHRLASMALVAEKIVTAEAFTPAEGGFASPCGFCRHKAACRKWHHEQARTISIAA